MRMELLDVRNGSGNFLEMHCCGVVGKILQAIRDQVGQVFELQRGRVIMRIWVIGKQNLAVVSVVGLVPESSSDGVQFNQTLQKDGKQCKLVHTCTQLCVEVNISSLQ